MDGKITLNDLKEKKCCETALVRYAKSGLEDVNWNDVSEIELTSSGRTNSESTTKFCKLFNLSMNVKLVNSETSSCDIVYENGRMVKMHEYFFDSERTTTFTYEHVYGGRTVCISRGSFRDTKMEEETTLYNSSERIMRITNSSNRNDVYMYIFDEHNRVIAYHVYKYGKNKSEFTIPLYSKFYHRLEDDFISRKYDTDGNFHIYSYDFIKALDGDTARKLKKIVSFTEGRFYTQNFNYNDMLQMVEFKDSVDNDFTFNYKDNILVEAIDNNNTIDSIEYKITKK